MTKVIAVANASGSAGKTTTVVSLADLLGRTQRVLVVDADAQGTATAWLGHDPYALTATLGDVLLRRTSPESAVLATKVKGVSLLPSNRSLEPATIQLDSAIGPEQRLRLALAKLEADVVLIDCPGSVATITISGLVAADAVLTVTQPTMKEATGVPELLDAVEAVREAFNPNLTFAGVVACIVPPRNQGRVYVDAMTALRQAYGDDVSPPVRRASQVPDSFARGIPLPSYAPNSAPTADYKAVLAWLKNRGVL